MIGVLFVKVKPKQGSRVKILNIFLSPWKATVYERIMLNRYRIEKETSEYFSYIL